MGRPSGMTHRHSSMSGRPSSLSRAERLTTKSFRETHYNLKCLAGALLEPVRKFRLEKDNARLCIHDNNLWVPCPKESDKCFDIYTLKGVQVNSVQNNEITAPQCIHPQTNQVIIVPDLNGLYVMNTDKWNCTSDKLADGVFWDVHINDSVIAALEKGRDGRNDLVHVFDNADPPKGHRVFGLENNYSWRVMVVGQHIYVSFSKPLTASYISKYNLEGIKVGQFGKLGSHKGGEMRGPVLSGYDEHQSLLITDYYNQQLQVLDTQGHWSVLRLPHLTGDLYPVDAVFLSLTDDILLVLVWRPTDDTYHIVEYKVTSELISG